MGKSIGIISRKGGVGKTSTVVSLGDALADFGQKVLLVDGNYSSPSIGFQLNIFDPEKTIKDVLLRNANITDSIYVFNNKFHILPAHLFDEVKVDPFSLRNKLKTVKNSYDIILIDSSPKLDEETLGAMMASDELFVVTTPDYATLAATIKSVKEARNRGMNIGGLILNKVHGKNFELTIKHVEDTAGVPVLAVIPYDINILKAQANFVPFTSQNPKSKASVEYKKLAGVLIGKKYQPFSIHELFRKLTPNRQELNRELYYKNIFN